MTLKPSWIREGVGYVEPIDDVQVPTRVKHVNVDALEELHAWCQDEIVRLQRADGDNSREIRTLAQVCIRIREMQRVR